MYTDEWLALLCKGKAYICAPGSFGGDGAQLPGCLEGTQSQALVSTQHRQCRSDTLVAEPNRPGSSLHVPPACLGGCH